MLSCFKIALWHIKGWKGSIRVIVVLLLTVVMAVYQSMEFIGYAKVTNGIVNCFETYITVVNSTWFPVVAFILALVLFADAPFMDNNSLYVVSRVGRYRWCIGKLLYIIIASIIFNLIIMFTSVVTSIAYAYPGDIWSETFFSLTKGSAVSLGYNVIFDKIEFMKRYTPSQLAFVCMSLVILLDCMIGVILFVLNAVNGKVLGFGVTSILYFAGYTISGTEIAKFLPKDNSILVMFAQGQGLSWSYMYFGIIIAVFIILTFIVIHRVDYKITIGERV